MAGPRRPNSIFGEAMRTRARVLGIKVPAGLLMLALMLAAVAWSVLPARTPSAVAKSVASGPWVQGSIATDASAAAVDVRMAVVPLAERARAGELVALKQIEQRPRDKRAIEESLALAAGHAVLKRADVARLLRDVEAEPGLMSDANTLRLLHLHAHDPEVAMTVLSTLARVDDPRAPDLLFDVWKNGNHPASRDLAEDLIHHDSVRARATPSLAIVLELLSIERCRKVQKLLPALVEHGDRRARPVLDRLRGQEGCGPKRGADCYRCLREPESEARIAAAMHRVRATPAPEPWATRKVQTF